MSNIARTKYNRSGFTLIELLVVIAIIGILSAVVLISLNSARSKGRDAQRRANMRQLVTALELYYNANGSYPSTGLEWWAESPAYGNHTLTGPNGYIPNLAPTYIGQLPHDPLTGTDRTSFHSACLTTETNYFYISDGSNYKILAYCVVEKVVASDDPFYDPIFPGYTLSAYTPGGSHY